ncbi:uncharacterized protein LOC133203668 [Saccostrea echinata]|uniref:uncharacterized protein LOC133203668 n=1 Tax=Saccostrea echinata TaxID=191078 RepID=UPI002A7EB239|nr:uncharacterized protein LOC133203668 [Saccostrea echinata]
MIATYGLFFPLILLTGNMVNCVLWNSNVSFASDDLHAIDYNYLMMQYISVCGVTNLCDESLVTSFNLTDHEFLHTPLCPECSCDVNCFKDSTIPCCPDLYFRYGVPQCRSVEIVYNTERNMSNYYTMLENCPPGTSTNLNEECTKERSPAEILVLPPVSSKDHDFIFWNKYCATCHNVSDIQPWSLYFQCKKNVDFNYLSSYEKIIDTANKSHCSVTFQGHGQHCVPYDGQDLISSCNVTGTWQIYDSTIDKACRSSYNSTYNFVFKNVFCYLCNPPTSKQISGYKQKTCPDPMSPFGKLCSSFPSTSITFPYSNIFCLLCHENEIEFDTEIKIIDQTNEVKIQYSIKIFPETFTKMMLLASAFDEQLHTRENYKTPEEVELNVTKLAIKNFAYSGGGLCSSEILNEDVKNIGSKCSCDASCFKDCCIDQALKNPITSCISTDFPPKYSEYGGYRIVDRCLGTTSDECHSNSKDLFQNVPLTSVKSGITYKNVFCQYCSSNSNSLLETTEHWGLNISCNQFINPDYFPSLQDFINSLKAAHCNIRLLPHKSAKPCDRIKADVNLCNITGLWSTEDIDVRKACEELKPNRLPSIGPAKNSQKSYKNIFCQMCNPVKQAPTEIIGHCYNSTNEIANSQALEAACGKLPYVQMSSNYKNIFCEKCNGYKTENEAIKATDLDIMHSLLPAVFNGDFRREHGKMPSYRTIFSLSSFDDDDDDNKGKEMTCFSDQHMDQSKNICRNKTCFPGKILRNSSCVSLLPQTKNLRYILYFRADLNENISATPNIETVCGAFHESIYNFLKHITHLDDQFIKIEEYTCLANKDCDTKELSGLQIYIQIVVFISGMVHRLETERNLVSFSNSLHNLPIRNTIYNFSLSQSGHSKLFPFFARHCIHKKNKSKLNNPEYRKVYVNNLLLCQQILLIPEEYKYNASTQSLQIKQWNISLPHDQFLLTENMSARVCVFNSTKPSTQEFEQSFGDSSFSLSVLTFVCIVISLVCLVITFIVYCIFQSLRTLPGLNNMCLIVSLFFAQLMTIIRPYILDFHIVAVVSSITMHYFWLCVFFWLSVCSFHMFRVFTRNTHKIKSEKDTCHAIIKYAAYAFGIPGLFVVIHLTVNVIASDGTLTGYENRNGLVNDKIAFIVTIITPMLLICLSNFFFFVITVYRIRNTPHAQKNQKQSVEVWVYVKLFALTGLTWIFQIVDAFLSVSFLSYIVAILNGLQGLFLFLSYVCNGRVLRLCCEKRNNNSLGSVSSSHLNSLVSTKKSTKF